ncbi:MAG: hypothetical protein LBN71_11285, partial [Tannerella sp.]|nr:hypothetical protein [Tannerella sp.]
MVQFFKKHISNRSLIVASLLLSVFVLYPKIIDLYWELSRIADHSDKINHVIFFIYRYLFFFSLMFYCCSFPSCHRLS